MSSSIENTTHVHIDSDSTLCVGLTYKRQQGGEGLALFNFGCCSFLGLEHAINNTGSTMKTKYGKTTQLGP